MNWQTVAIPFAAGIKPTSRGRTLDQTKLLIAQNCFFEQDEGPQKRYGHISRPVKTSGAPIGLDGIIPPAAAPFRAKYSLANPGLADSWLYGWGILGAADDSTTAAAYAVGDQPHYGSLFGAWTRDSEAVLWDGFRAASYPDSQTAEFGQVTGQATFPVLNGAPIAKSLAGQLKPDAADNGEVRTVAWVSGTIPYRAVYDSVSGACLVNEEGFTGEVTSLRVLTLGPWTHIVVHDSASDNIDLHSFHQDTPGSVVIRSIGPATEDTFDVKKISENFAVIAKIDTNIDCTVINADGSTYTVYDPAPTTTGALNVAVEVRGTVLGLLWQNGSFQPRFAMVEVFSGVQITAATNVGIACQAASHITLAPSYIPSDLAQWAVYIEDGTLASFVRHVRVYEVTTSGVQLKTTRYNTVLGSHAFRVGNRSYVWCSGTPTVFVLQPTWFLCDEKLLPVGKALFALAYQEEVTVTLTLPSVNWHTLSLDHPEKDRFVFFGSLGYRQRAKTNTDNTDPNGVWLEPSIFFYKLDFLPPIISAQAGRSTYIAGAQLWEYDGANLNEAGFHLAPESYAITSAGVGNLDETKVYRWRIDLCYKNAQNEEIRSWSTTATWTPPVETDPLYKARLTIPHVPMTRRDSSYFLIYRTEGNGTEYYLVSSRNPADVGLSANKFLFNDRGSANYTFDDNLTDAVLIGREYHPANAAGYLQPFSAPACELVSSGRDRLWVSGGELSAGEIAPSRYFLPGAVPLFTPALNLQIDRNSEPITAIGFVGEQAAFFRETSTYVMDSDGPDNVNQGVWGFPRLALSDVGAVAQETLALAGEGLYFQSPAGMRVLTQGGGLRPPGAGLIGGLGTDVDTLAVLGNYSAAVVVPKHSQIRWYSRDPEKPSLVVDYTKNVWTTWTGLETAKAVYWPPGDTVILTRGAGDVWTEVEGRYLDGDNPYETVVKTAWLHGAALGDYERVRRFALFGEATTGLSLRYRVFYDERPFFSEEGLVTFIGTNPTTKFNPSTWGAVSWGFGPWGDESAQSNTGSGSGLWFRDGMFKFRRRFARQKCSVFSLEFSDQSSNAAFTPVVLALELGTKQGLDRIP